MRTKKAIYNLFAGFGGRIFNLLLVFVTRTVFVRVLCIEYLGISSLFSSIISILNLTDLGIGTALTYAMYEPLAKKNMDKVRKIMKLYKDAYWSLGFAVLILSILLLPALPYLIKGSTDLVNLNLVYFFYVFDVICSYWFSAYYCSILIADQKEYIKSIVYYICSFMGKIFQCMILILLRKTPEIAFYIYSAIGILINVSSNLFIRFWVRNKYSYLKKKFTKGESLDKTERNHIFKNIYGAAVYKISGTVNNTVDNFFVSAFMGTATMGVYSNYITITSTVSQLLNIVFNSVVPGIGNYCAVKSNEEKEELFRTIKYISFFLYGMAGISIWILANPFIATIWLGKEFIMEDKIVFFIAINLVVDGLMNDAICFRNACGLYWQSRYRAIAATISNIILSYIFLTFFDLGIVGLLLGTILSRLCITLWVDPYIVYKYVFNKSSKKYYITYFLQLILIIIPAVIIYWSTIDFPVVGYKYFFIKLSLCIIVPLLIWFPYMILNKDLFDIVKKIIKKIYNLKRR